VLSFNFDQSIKPIYPTAINILLGGPGQKVSMTNNLNSDATYIQYIVALVMLWVAIILPFVLLRIVTDYIVNVSIDDERFGYIRNGLKKLSLTTDMFGKGTPIFGKQLTPKETSTMSETKIPIRTTDFASREQTGISTPNISSTPSPITSPISSVPRVDLKISPVVQQANTLIPHPTVPVVNMPQPTGIGEIPNTMYHELSKTGVSPLKQNIGYASEGDGTKSESDSTTQPLAKDDDTKQPTQPKPTDGQVDDIKGPPSDVVPAETNTAVEK